MKKPSLVFARAKPTRATVPIAKDGQFQQDQSPAGRILRTTPGHANLNLRAEGNATVPFVAGRILLSELHTLIRSIAFTPDGESLFAASDDGSIRMWSVHTIQNR